MADLRYLENSWALDRAENPLAVTDLGNRKKQFAYKIWKDDFITHRSREDGKESELKQLQSDIYQLIGFYSVFQGVWFQGVAQLAPGLSCRASAIPIVLSVLVSIATIIGVHLILSKMYRLKTSFLKDKLQSKIRECRISKIERDGLNFDMSTIGLETSQSLETSNFERRLVKLHRTRLVLLLFLTILSALFAWLVGATICDKFP